MRFYRADDFHTPALGIVVRWGLIGFQLGRRNYILLRAGVEALVEEWGRGEPQTFAEALSSTRDRESWTYAQRLRELLEDNATTAAQNLRDELQGAQERLRRVRELADEIEREGWVDYTYTAKALRAALDAEP